MAAPAPSRRLAIEGLEAPSLGSPKYSEFRSELFRSAVSFGVVECIVFESTSGGGINPIVQFQKLGSAVKMKDEFDWSGISASFIQPSIVVSTSMLLQGELDVEKRMELLKIFRSYIPAAPEQVSITLKHVPQLRFSASGAELSSSSVEPCILGMRDIAVLNVPTLVATNAVLTNVQAQAATMNCYIQHFPSSSVKDTVCGFLNVLPRSDVLVGAVLHGYVVRATAGDASMRVNVGIATEGPEEGAQPTVQVEQSSVGLAAARFGEGSRVRVRLTDVVAAPSTSAMRLKGVILGEDRTPNPACAKVLQRDGVTVSAVPTSSLAGKLFRAIQVKASASASAIAAACSTERLAPLPLPLKHGSRLAVKMVAVEQRGVVCDVLVFASSPSLSRVQGLIVPSLVKRSVGVPWDSVFVVGETLTAVPIAAGAISSSITTIFLSTLTSHVAAATDEGLTAEQFKDYDPHKRPHSQPIPLPQGLVLEGDVVAILDASPGPAVFFDLCLPSKSLEMPPALISAISEDHVLGVCSGISLAALRRLKIGDVKQLRCVSLSPHFQVVVDLSSTSTDTGRPEVPVVQHMTGEEASADQNRKRHRDT